MKKILIPTDFSPVADNAMLYAAEIAIKFKSELVLYHAYSFDRFNYDLNYPESEQPYTKELEQKMKLTKLRLREKINKHGLVIDTFVKKGSILSLFQSEVSNHDIDMIVLGTKGASGLKKVVFGSVAAEALEMAKVPVLAIPPGLTFRPIEHIVLAIDHKEHAAGSTDPLQELASRYGAKVTLLNVNTNPVGHSQWDANTLSLEGVETSYQEVQMSKSVNDTINKYIKKTACDLLCMIKREKGFIERVFQKSIAKEQVYKSQVPLLVLPEKG